MKEQTGDVITFAQFEKGNILTETNNSAESGDESDNKSIMMSEQDMENLDSNEVSYHDLISTEMLEDIGDGVRPIRTLIEGKHVIKYVIILGKGNKNGKER